MRLIRWRPDESHHDEDGRLSLIRICLARARQARTTANYYAPCKHRVVAPAEGERIGLPFLFRGRSDAVLNTMPHHEAAAASGRPVRWRVSIPRPPRHGAACPRAWRVAPTPPELILFESPRSQVHLAEMETTTIKELPAFDSAKAILKNWFKSVKNPEQMES